MFRFLVAVAVVSFGVVGSAEAGWRRCCGLTCSQPACCQPACCSACAPAPAPTPCCAPAPVVTCCPTPTCCPAPACCPTNCCRLKLFRSRCCNTCPSAIQPASCCQTADVGPIFGRPILFAAFRPRLDAEQARARAEAQIREMEAARIAYLSRQSRSNATRSNPTLASLSD